MVADDQTVVRERIVMLRMPRCDGVEATRRVRPERPGSQVVVLTTYADDDSLFPTLAAGARGYLPKDADSDEVIRAIDHVLPGEAGLSPKMQRRLLERFTEPVPWPQPSDESPRMGGPHVRWRCCG